MDEEVFSITVTTITKRTMTPADSARCYSIWLLNNQLKVPRLGQRLTCRVDHTPSTHLLSPPFTAKQQAGSLTSHKIHQTTLLWPSQLIYCTTRAVNESAACRLDLTQPPNVRSGRIDTFEVCINPLPFQPERLKTVSDRHSKAVIPCQ